MAATVAEVITFAYAAFLVGLLAYNMRPQARRSRKLRKRIKSYTAR